MTVPADVRIFDPEAEWADEAAEFVLWEAERAITDRGRFLWALSGGATPRGLYEAMARAEWSSRLDWKAATFLFGDERCVAPDHRDSNFGMARAALFEPLGIPESRIMRMRGEDPDPERAAREYEATLRRECPVVDQWPKLDLVSLGLGEDGHVASLFPATEALVEQRRWVVPSRAPAGGVPRLTLTLGVINRASVILFLVTGAAKAGVVRAVLEPRTEGERLLPAARVTPRGGRVVWLLDGAAAADLTITKQHPTSREE